MVNKLIQSNVDQAEGITRITSLGERDTEHHQRGARSSEHIEQYHSSWSNEGRARWTPSWGPEKTTSSWSYPEHGKMWHWCEGSDNLWKSRFFWGNWCWFTERCRGEKCPRTANRNWGAQLSRISEFLSPVYFEFCPLSGNHCASWRGRTQYL